MEVIKNKLLNDRHGALIIYPDPEGRRDVHQVAKREAKKVLRTDKDVRIEELIPHVLPNGQEVVIAVYPYTKKQESPRLRCPNCFNLIPNYSGDRCPKCGVKLRRDKR